MNTTALPPDPLRVLVIGLPRLRPGPHPLAVPPRRYRHRRLHPPSGRGGGAGAHFLHHLTAIDLTGYDIAILALPSGALASVLDQVPRCASRAAVLSCVKGMDAETDACPTDLAFMRRRGTASPFFEGLAGALAHPPEMAARLLATID